MLALWALFLLSAMIITWTLDIDGRITLSGNANRALEAVAMACSGSEVALHRDVKPGSPVLEGRVGNHQSYAARITGEGGRLNLNWLASNDPRHQEVLRKFLENKGIDLNERDHMIDCLLDWVDPDNLVRLNGAETTENYKPANHWFTQLEDLRKVKGWGEFTSIPGWEDYFTVAQGTGPIDLAWASRDVLLALPGMTPEIVDRFLKVRSGEDGIDGTADDPPFKSLADYRIALGLNPEQFEQFTGLINFNGQVLRVVSVGKSGDVTRVVQIVFVKTGVPQVITWKEL
jgi:type II secretory pathway component PulK